MIETATEPSTLIAAACKIATAYVSHNYVAPADLPTLVTSIHALLAGWAPHSKSLEVAPEPEPKLAPAQIRKSITSDALISFIDGKPYKTLKRHLLKHGFTPEAYRTRFGLPLDYPMVAQSYAQRRSVIAKQIGFGIRMGRGAKHRTK